MATDAHKVEVFLDEWSAMRRSIIRNADDIFFMDFLRSWWRRWVRR